MKKIGLIGGMSWESSLEYYRIINETAKLKLGGLHSAECIMYSVDFEEIEALQHQNKWKELTKIMVNTAESLKKAGADFIVICTNTMHKMASDIENEVGIKVLHIAEVTGEKIIKKEMKKVGLLGTKFTMEGDFYKKVLKDKFNIDVVIPDEADRDIVHQVIYEELCKGIINEASREKYKRIIEQLASKGAEGIVLGCTEIPLLIKQEDVNIPIFDTTTIHAVSAVEFALDKVSSK
ncbi:aspartate/glutamate racemase family protein [Clostridium sp. PL3]|uniref:Aspartate/glutamate racemase family protein n=1 Tax=Clostridium thailandense TaxID=2794346 RepID=A0A949TQM5_9CLOT|nr:aspartate/glutamate racemase family protein [Clostridium thailandense]MBV7271436.1 aspartate/glutamate racemase family protein [Clostridium thailandense]